MSAKNAGMSGKNEGGATTPTGGPAALSLEALRAAVPAGRMDPRLEARIDAATADLSEAAAGLADAGRAWAEMSHGAAALIGELKDFSHFLNEMGVLEEKMRGIAELGRTLVRRLHGSDPDGARAAAGSASA
jgi:hypothetical protein